MATTTLKTVTNTKSQNIRMAISALFFQVEAKSWPFNKPLTQGKLRKELTAIQQEHSLDKLRIVRQLKNYKDNKYGLKDIFLLQLLEQTRED